MGDEFARIEWLKTRFELDDAPEGLVLGIGDDAAVFDFGNRPTIVTVDTQIEGAHFRRDWISPRDLGRKALAAAVSDIWAMGGVSCASIVALSLPSGMSEQDFHELVEGIAGAARTTGATVIGGNLSAGEHLSVTTTAFGWPKRSAVTRAGARPGDLVYVTGTLGAAALGLAILQAGRADLEYADRFVERWRRPPMNGRAAISMAEVATAAVDVSDGCVQDLAHLCAASGVGARVHADALPLARGHLETAEALGLDPRTLALAGGEDYELLFTAAPSSEAEAFAAEIGRITEGSEVEVVDADGRPLTLDRAGFRHFK